MYLYILFNDVNNKTYNGFTTDVVRRIKQHNNEKKTKKEDIVWCYLCIIECAELTPNNVLSLSWYIKHPVYNRIRPKEYQGVHGRIQSLNVVLNKNKFKNMNFKIHVDPYFVDEMILSLSELKNVEIISM